MSQELNVAPAISGFAPVDALFVTLATNATLSQERVLTGSSNILITDNGAGGTVVLSTQGPYTPTTLTAGGVLLGQAAGSITAVAVPSTAGNYLRSVANTNPIWSTLTLPNTATRGDLLFASAANAIGNLADVAVGSYLRAGGVGADPLWSTLTLPNTVVAGDLPIATSANVLGVITAVAAGRVLQSAGAGVVPAYTATPVLGIAGTTQGSLGLSGVTAGVVTLAVPANVTTPWSFTLPGSPPVAGGIARFSNSSGQLTATGALTANSLILAQGTGAPTALGAATNGQLPIGNTGNNPTLAALTAGTGIIITNAAGAITIETNLTGATASTNPPPSITNQTNVAGTLLRYAREDHTHSFGQFDNNISFQVKESGGTARNLLTLNTSNQIELGNTALSSLFIKSPNAVFLAGAAAALGTQDNFSLTFRTNNVDRITLSAAGGLSIGDATDPGAGKLRVTGGISNSNTGFQHKRATVSIPALSTGTLVSLAWNTAFADTNYTLAVSVVRPTGVAVISWEGAVVAAKTASGFDITVSNTGAGAVNVVIEAIGVHD